MAPDALLSIVRDSLDDDKAKAVTVIDMENQSSIADYLVIASGTSSRQVVSMADHIEEKLKEAGFKDSSTSGKTQGDWVLLDAGDVIVHLFRPEVRQFYNLEKMWGLETPSVEEILHG